MFGLYLGDFSLCGTCGYIAFGRIIVWVEGGDGMFRTEMHSKVRLVLVIVVML